MFAGAKNKRRIALSCRRKTYAHRQDQSEALENGWTCLNRHPEDLHGLIKESKVEWKKSTGRLRRSNVGQMKCDARVNTFKDLKEKANNQSECRIPVFNQPSANVVKAETETVLE